MKLTIVLILFSCIAVQARTNGQQISLSLKNAPIGKVLKEIQKQSGYNIVYNASILKHEKNADINIRNATIDEALNECFANSPVRYEIVGKTIILKPAVTVALNAGPVQRRISGTVKDSSGNPIPGASVLIKGSRTGTATDNAGSFSIQASPGDILIISSIGYEPQEVKVTENNNTISVILKAAQKQIEDVVVTALGIKRSAKSLTYNVQDVKNEEITRIPDGSFVNSLSGKVAGVTINASASGIGGSTRVVMRGDKSLNPSGNNNALYVLDGIPLPNLFSSSSVTSNSVYGGKDGGDGISDFNPEDIADISVLTGASAAALYGGMAANGAVLITSKQGLAKDNKIHLSFSNSTSLYNPFVMPKFQDEYGTSSPGSFDSWGAKMGTPSTYDPADFFQTGVSEFNSIGLMSDGEKSQTYFSAASNNARGIIPSNTFNRYNLTLRHAVNLTKNLTLDITGMYIRSKNQNMFSQGQYLNPLIPVYLFPRGADIQSIQLYERYDQDRNFKTQYWPDSYGTQNMAMQNPYWTINRDFNNLDKERYIIGANLNYKISGWLNIAGRVRFDNTSDHNTVRNYASTLTLLTNGSDNGSYLDLIATTSNTYADVLATIDKSFGTIGLNANVGSSVLDSRFAQHGNSIDGNGAPLSKIPNLFSSSNIIPQQEPGSEPEITQVQSVYAKATLDYRKLVFLDVTGRNEWPSQLADSIKSNRSLFYPSVGLSGIISDMLKLPRNVISYLKLRGSYSEVGNPPLSYMQNPPYGVTVSGPSLNTTLPFNLTPERTKSIEVGMNAAFLRNIFTLDVTLYNTNTYNQIFSFVAPASSGYTNYYVNAGKVNNKGIEAVLGFNDKIGAVAWTSNIAITLNRNKIVEAAENAINPFTGEKIGTSDSVMAGIGSAASVAKKGGSVGDLYVNSLLTDPGGYILINNATGGNVQANNKNLIYAGNPNPRYNLGFRNGFSYKNFALNFLIDWRIGGQVVSATQAIMDGYGVSEASAKARDNGGVLINGFPIDAQKYYQTVGLGTGVLSQYVYSATNARLREASLSYTIPSRIFHDKLQSLTLSVTGRNLFMFYNKAPFDPENTASTGTYFQGIDYFMQPSLRSFGFSLKANF